MIAYVDAGERYHFANKGYTDWFGIDKNTIAGKSITEVFGIDAYTQIRPYLDQAYTGERVSYEYSRINAAGRQVYARSVVVPEASEAGGVQGFFVLSIDITEQKASQAALIQAQKMEAVGQLTGGLAHDFNNLLTIITGNLATLKGKLPANPDFENHLEPALAAARRGAELIRRLLTFSRQQSLDACPVEVGALVRGMNQLLSRSLTERIAIRLALPADKLYALVDPHQLESALLNLAINARDAMPDGGTLTISLATRHVSPSLALLGALGSLDPAGHAARLAAYLQQQPSLNAARELLEPLLHQHLPQAAPDLLRALDSAARPLLRHRCAACGFESAHYFWQCPGCLSWDSFPPIPVEGL